MNETFITVWAIWVISFSALSVLPAWKGVIFCLWWLAIAIEKVWEATTDGLLYAEHVVNINNKCR